MIFISRIVITSLLAYGNICIASERLDQGRSIYGIHCASCHDTGLKSAPVTGCAKDWHNRSRLWEAVLFEHANAGYLAMPSKGGAASLTEYEVDVAAEYILSVTYPEMSED